MTSVGRMRRDVTSPANALAGRNDETGKIDILAFEATKTRQKPTSSDYGHGPITTKACRECSASPAWRGVCLTHLLTVSPRALARLLGVHRTSVQARRRLATTRECIGCGAPRATRWYCAACSAKRADRRREQRRRLVFADPTARRGVFVRAHTESFEDAVIEAIDREREMRRSA